MSIRRMMLFTLGAKIKNLVQAFKERVLATQGQFEAETCLDTQLTELDNDNLLDNASLIVTPNGYKENLLYAVEPNDIGTNLFLRSEEFENAAWTKVNSTITVNTTTAPNGTMTADKLVANNLTGTHLINQSITVSSPGVYTASVYVKKSGYDGFRINYINSTNARVSVNLDTGVIANASGTSYLGSTITNVGDNWYRVTITVTSPIGVNSFNFAIESPVGTITFTGDGTSGIFLWGAQLVPGSTVTNYISTTDRQIINGTIGDMSVTRATTATRVNADGFIEEVPYNLFSQTQNFENASWTKQLTTIGQNAITAPDGTLTADNVIANSGATYVYTGTLGVNIVSNSFLSRNLITVSFYLKYNGLNRIRVMYGTSTNMSGGYFVEVDLQVGIITNQNLVTNSFIQDAGNGWYRVGFSAIINGSPTNNRLGVGLGDSVKTIANGVDGVYIWGAQLVDGTQAKDYFPTTNRFNIPRIDYSNGSCPSILVEPQRTNLLLQSEDFTNGWSLEGTSITSNTQISPNNLPIADTLSELGTLDVHRTYRSAITVTANALYTSSFFVKKNNIRYVRLVLTQNGSTTIWAGAQFDLDTQTFTSQVGIGGGVFTSAKITAFTNGWFRISVVGSIPSTLMIPMLVLSNGDAMLNTDTRGCPIYLGNTSNSLYVWGAQLELGPNITSYIPTTTATVTRNADVITNTNVSTLIGQSEGTIFVDYNKVLAPDTPRNIIGFTDGTSNNLIEIWDGVGSANLGMLVYTCTTNAIFKSAGLGQTTISPTGRYKICLTYSFTPTNMNFKFFVNGVKIRDDNPTFTAFSNPLSRVNIGNRNGTFVGVGGHNIDFISKTAITDAQAIQLTTL